MRKYLRTCRYKDENYLFHCFEKRSSVIPPSIMRGGHPGGEISRLFALIEDAEGHIFRVDPTEIVFTDDEFDNHFPEPEK